MTEELTPWEVLRTQDVLDCSPWFRVVADDVLLPNGRVVQRYYRIESLDFVMIFPLADDGRVLALRGYYDNGTLGNLNCTFDRLAQ